VPVAKPRIDKLNSDCGNFPGRGSRELVTPSPIMIGGQMEGLLYTVYAVAAVCMHTPI
jgi:hypothetical protein